jgi:molybdopterin-guanine dinucleotide biosynthesis protein A
MPAEDKVPAVVLAGGGADEKVARPLGLPHKSLVTIGGETSLALVVEALRAAAGVSDVVVVSSCAEVREACPAGVACVPPRGPDFLDTIRAGLEHFPEADAILVCTSDLALLTPAAVDDFLRQALDSGADVCYSMVERGRLQGLPGEHSRTYVHLREGRFTGGNVALISRAFVEQHGQRLTQAFAGRKNPLALASMFGLPFIWRLLRGKLDVPALVRRGDQILQARLAVVNSQFVEICFDLDDPEHVQQAEEMLAQRQAP